MRIDLHVHLRRGQNLAELRRILRARRLGGIAVTNFHNVSFAHFVRERLPEFLIILGQEVESSAGHILAIGIHDLIPDRLSPQESIRRIHSQGGLAILPHPYLIRNSIFYHAFKPRLAFDAVETFNWRCGPLLWPNPVARLTFKNSSLPKVATTDSKDPRTIGRCYVEVPAYGEAEVLACLRRGDFVVHEETVRPSFSCVKNYFSQLFLPHRHFTCFHCRDRLVFRPFRQRRVCSHCGHAELLFVTCPRGHFICAPCRTRIAYEPEAFLQYRSKHGLEV